MKSLVLCTLALVGMMSAGVPAHGQTARQAPSIARPPQAQSVVVPAAHSNNVSAQLAASVGLDHGPGCGCTTTGCSHCCPSSCCCGCCLHATGGFGDYMYLTARGIDIAYAVPQDGIGGIGTVPVGPVGVLNYDYDSGFRTGFNVALDCYSSVTASLMWYETRTNDSISIGAPNVIQPLVMFPGTFNAGFTAQQASASTSLDFQLADIDYRAVWKSGKNFHIDYIVGARYGNMDQEFEAIFPFAPPDGTTQVATDINFDGAGIRMGLDGERLMLPCAGVRVYAKSVLSLLAGEMRTSYVQTNQFNNVEASTSWDEDRVVPIMELEAGLSWTNCSGTIRASAGYYFASWSNIVSTPEYINAVQNSNYVDVAQDAYDTITFDGLVGRIEFRL